MATSDMYKNCYNGKEAQVILNKANSAATLPGSEIFSVNSNYQSNGTTWDVYTTLRGSKVFDAPSIASGASTSTTVIVTGAALGQYADAAFSLSVAGLVVTAYVSAVNTVTVVFANLTGAPVDLASGTLSVKVTS